MNTIIEDNSMGKSKKYLKMLLNSEINYKMDIKRTIVKAVYNKWYFSLNSANHFYRLYKLLIFISL